jgi:hypothetical protein
MAGTAGTVIWPAAIDRRYNRRVIASRNVDGSNEPVDGSSISLFYLTLARSSATAQEMALTAVDNRDLNASGIGTYPLSANPFWPAPMVLCRKALTAPPTWASAYFEQTIS